MQKTDSAVDSGKQLTFGSLFAGIGGFDLGFERAGMVCRWQVEIDQECRNDLAMRWPNVRQHDDVRTWGSPTAEPVDVICGGFPCQDISNAGLRKGITGERSGLWSEIARIAGDLQPRFVVVENVSALLGRGMGRVLGDLATLGYDAEWECLPASAFGAHHRRDRVFIIAYRPDSVRLRPQRQWPPPKGLWSGNNLRDWFRQTYGFLYPPVRVVEYLMGFEIGNTCCTPSETQSSRKSQNGLAGG